MNDLIQRPFWSVMVPAFEPSEHFLKQALDSVLGQDQGADQMQIHVVDDCSPNVDVAKMVHRIAGDRISVSRNPVNLGLAGCWNECLQKSKGQWIHLFHQDDLLHHGFYQTLEALIQTQPDAGAAFCRCNYVDSIGAVLGPQSRMQNHDGILHGGVCQLAIRNEIQCPAIVVNKKAYDERGGFDAQYSFVLDWEMWLRIASKFIVLYSGETLASFRIQKSSQTFRLAQSAETVYDTVRLIDRLGKYVPGDRLSRIQLEAKAWTTDLAIRHAQNFLDSDDIGFAMNLLRAVLATDGSRRNWRIAIGLWIKAMATSKCPVTPPIPWKCGHRLNMSRR